MQHVYFISSNSFGGVKCRHLPAMVVSPVSDAIDTTVVSIDHLWTIHDGRVRNIHHYFDRSEVNITACSPIILLKAYCCLWQRTTTSCTGREKPAKIQWSSHRWASSLLHCMHRLKMTAFYANTKLQYLTLLL